MTRDELERALQHTVVVAENSEYLRSIARSCVHMRRSSAPVSKGGSRFGGWPDLPTGSAWPTHEEGPYRFIAQINFGEVDVPGTGLPNEGLLSVFAADDESEALSWSDPEYVRSVFTPHVSRLEPVRPPASVDHGGSTRIWFEEGVAFPLSRELRNDWPDARLADALAAWWRVREDSGRRPFDHLLGYPRSSTLAYDPTPGMEWVSLLTLSSDDELEWGWHDGGYLNVFIERARLEASDFSRLRSDAG